ncbi:hypothetical protein WR25_16322 [Diploscapter pachys]|uniref:Uncharacterized protein n=1 Tax=Diploscapter pachys TaxID=2018661 RepID=A0A2A2JD49_9BILA|nr:hypothetical protein WR25_16322 [Diploscapter pachys]
MDCNGKKFVFYTAAPIIVKSSYTSIPFNSTAFTLVRQTTSINVKTILTQRLFESGHDAPPKITCIINEEEIVHEKIQKIASE